MTSVPVCHPLGVLDVTVAVIRGRVLQSIKSLAVCMQKFVVAVLSSQPTQNTFLRLTEVLLIVKFYFA